MKNNKIFALLKNKHKIAEIADAIMIPADLTEAEKRISEEEIRKYRVKKLVEATGTDHIISDIMRLRFQIDNYLKQPIFSFEQTFGKFLAEYIRIWKKSRRIIAEDLSIHYTKLSRIINDREEPNIEFCYRLEKHADTLISAQSWWKLMIKKQEFIITQDQETRNIEQEKVKNSLSI